MNDETIQGAEAPVNAEAAPVVVEPASDAPAVVDAPAPVVADVVVAAPVAIADAPVADPVPTTHGILCKIEEALESFLRIPAQELAWLKAEIAKAKAHL